MASNKRKFDSTRHKRRHIALKILYFGWDLNGLAFQDNSESTVEYHLFQALTKTCLIESRSSCNYNRCGRTDKGVSSYGQVVNLDVRSNLIDESDPQNVGLFTPEGYRGGESGELKNPKGELNFVDLLNRVLPDHIKAIAWAPVREGFSSRFNCRKRSYYYIFPVGDLCIPSMQKAMSYLIGAHDFRNLCSFDLKNGVINHQRTIVSAHIAPIAPIGDTNFQANNNPYSFYEIVIVGEAFLYHQIRCIMTILFLVGTRREQPEIVRDLLDIEGCPSRPCYNRASPVPLCLFNCEYSPKDLPLGWMYNIQTLYNLQKQLKCLWLQYKTKSMMIERVLFDLDSMTKVDNNSSDENNSNNNLWKDFGLGYDGMGDKKYTPIMKRPRDETLEKRLDNLSKKKKETAEKVHDLTTPSSSNV